MSLYHELAIKSFSYRGLKRLYEQTDRRGIRPDLADTVERILTVLDAADATQALDLPGYRLHRLKGDRKGYRAVTVRTNWRITFRFEDGHGYEIDLVDYH